MVLATDTVTYYEDVCILEFDPDQLKVESDQFLVSPLNENPKKSLKPRNKRKTKNRQEHRKCDKLKYICFMCSKKFFKKPDLMKHIATHGEFCNYSLTNAKFYQQKYLKPVERETPTIRVRYPSECESDDERKFICDHCPWKFKTKNLLNGHLVWVHTGEALNSFCDT